jgi:DNA polymerase III delta subunit
MVADRSGFKAFELNDHLFGGRPEHALRELDNVLASGEPAEKVLSQIGGQAVDLAAMKMGSGLPSDALSKASGIGANRFGMLQKSAAPLANQTLTRIAEAIRDADASVKTGTKTDTSATIVPLVAEVAEVIRRGSGAGRRRS